MSIRKKLQERSKQLKEQGSHFSEEDMKNLRRKALLQLETLDSVYEEERRRQQLLMSKRLTQKKIKMENPKSFLSKIRPKILYRFLQIGFLHTL